MDGVDEKDSYAAPVVDSGSGSAMLVVLVLCSFRDVFLRGWQAQTPGIVAGMNQKEWYVATLLLTCLLFTTTGAVLQCAENFGFSAVAAHLQGRLHPRRGAEVVSHGPDCSSDN